MNNSRTINRISACLVVRNEERNIDFCLQSLMGVVDEVVLVHDGNCDDKTLEIAKKYNATIFIRPYVGMMEAHLLFALHKTTGDWVLRIDADEFLTDGLKSNLRSLVVSADIENISAYSFAWTDFIPESSSFIKSKERKTPFFRRRDLYWFTMPHFAWQTRGETRKTDYVLGQIVTKRSGKAWLRAQKKWARIQAEYLIKDYGDLDNFQAKRIDWEKVYSFSRHNSKNPLLPILKTIKSLAEELIIKKVGLKKACKRALYNFYLGYYIYYLSRRS